MSVAKLARRFAASGATLAEITGGEPLAQDGFRALALALKRSSGGRPVLVETNGSLDISVIPSGVTAIMDVKCPGSGEAAAMDFGNLDRLRPEDEVKFVLTDRRDFLWALRLVKKHRLSERCHAVLFSPVAGTLSAATLADWVLASGQNIRLQVQLHKLLNVK